ncbi:MAG: hypothetical protein JO000_14220, partial [Alphaproteobacteria bacterium]|nr:hypothetical protein [Alphaproteobacteria bacterium]
MPAARLSPLAAFVMVCVALGLSLGSAHAQCVPHGPGVPNGATVTCTGTDTTGVGNGSQNNVTVNVQPGAAITVGNFGTAISLHDGNSVTNAGTVTGSVGIVTNLNNTVVNSGVITVTGGDTSAIYLSTGSVINTSTGVITVTNPHTGFPSFGIIGNGAPGSGALIVNNGQIFVSDGTPGSLGDFNVGILGYTNANVTNNGSITAGIAGVGISVSGVNGAYINNGTITGGAAAFGVLIGYNFGVQSVMANTITNNGTIQVGAGGYSLYEVTGNSIRSNTIVNNGRLDGRITLANDALTNAGLITVTDPGTALGQNFVLSASSFTQTAAGTLALRVNGAGASDSLKAQSAQLGGTLAAVLQPGLY